MILAIMFILTLVSTKVNAVSNKACVPTGLTIKVIEKTGSEGRISTSWTSKFDEQVSYELKVVDSKGNVKFEKTQKVTSYHLG